ncbi:MAG TPA: septal ring lytic transglycosylase RlpA family protein [Pseudomonadales bacterium]|nr:septal ring lytic transglycosylase RlpA family protein [Pseudomonadales bacterium]
MATEQRRTAPGVRALRWLAPLVAAVLLVGGCAGPAVKLPGTQEQDAPPLLDRPGLETQADPVPRWEPAGGAGNRSPYMVFGKTYHVMPSALGYREEGLASWYGRKFHGRNTSNGERYDMFALTAAHKSLPLPTWLRVTNLDNGRSTIVRVNDRGPFHGDRIIDLSYGAAVKLGYADSGVTRVSLEAIHPPRPGAGPLLVEAPPAEPAVDAPAAPVEAEDLAHGGGRIWLQAGAFGDPASAAALQIALQKMLGTQGPGVDVQLATGDDALTRVRIGPLPDLAEAGRLQALITVADLAGVPLIVRE